MHDSPSESFQPPVMIRLTLEHMQWQIVQALYPREVELEEATKRAVARAVESFDFEQEVYEQARREIRQKINDWVYHAVHDVLNTSKCQKQIQAEVKRQLKENEACA
jgi:dephospho-CoA kinase